MQFKQGEKLREEAFFGTAWKRINKVCMGLAVKLMEKGKNCEYCTQRYRHRACLGKTIACVTVRHAFAIVGDELSHGHLHDEVYKQHKVCDDKK